MNQRSFDWIIYGSGVSSLVLAERLSSQGRSIALVNPGRNWDGVLAGTQENDAKFDVEITNFKFELFAEFGDTDIRTYDVDVRIEEMRKLLQERHLSFLVKQDTKGVAFAICLKIREGLLYNFYWGDVLRLEQFSPVAYLVKVICEYCRETGILDAGISKLTGKTSYGLMKFKENMRISPSLKLTFGEYL